MYACTLTKIVSQKNNHFFWEKFAAIVRWFFLPGFLGVDFLELSVFNSLMTSIGLSDWLCPDIVDCELPGTLLRPCSGDTCDIVPSVISSTELIARCPSREVLSWWELFDLDSVKLEGVSKIVEGGEIGATLSFDTSGILDGVPGTKVFARSVFSSVDSFWDDSALAGRFLRVTWNVYQESVNNESISNVQRRKFKAKK